MINIRVKDIGNCQETLISKNWEIYQIKNYKERNINSISFNNLKKNSTFSYINPENSDNMVFLFSLDFSEFDEYIEQIRYLEFEKISTNVDSKNVLNIVYKKGDLCIEFSTGVYEQKKYLRINISDYENYLRRIKTINNNKTNK